MRGIAWARKKVHPAAQGFAAARVQPIWPDCTRFPTIAPRAPGRARQEGAVRSECFHVPAPPTGLTGLCPHGWPVRSGAHGACRTGRWARVPDAGAPPRRPGGCSCAEHPRQRRIGGGDCAGCVAARLDRRPALAPQAAFRTWLYRIVVNLCLNAKRRPASLPLDAADDAADPAPRPMRNSSSASRTGGSPRRSRLCRTASAPRSCSPIRKGSAMPKPRRARYVGVGLRGAAGPRQAGVARKTGFELSLRGAHDKRS